MNILIRAEGITGLLPPPWYQVPTDHSIWVYELRATTPGQLPDELNLIADTLTEAAARSSKFVLHFGKYDDLQSLVLPPELLTLITREQLTVEVH